MQDCLNHTRILCSVHNKWSEICVNNSDLLLYVRITMTKVKKSNGSRDALTISNKWTQFVANTFMTINTTHAEFGEWNELYIVNNFWKHRK